MISTPLIYHPSHHRRFVQLSHICKYCILQCRPSITVCLFCFRVQPWFSSCLPIDSSSPFPFSVSKTRLETLRHGHKANEGTRRGRGMLRLRHAIFKFSRVRIDSWARARDSYASCTAPSFASIFVQSAQFILISTSTSDHHPSSWNLERGRRLKLAAASTLFSCLEFE